MFNNNVGGIGVFNFGVLLGGLLFIVGIVGDFNNIV